LLISRQSSTIRRNLSAELIRVDEVSGALVGLGVVAVLLNDGYFFSKSCCLIAPKRTNTGVFDFVIVVVGTLETFRSIDKRGLVVANGSTANARKGSFEGLAFVVTPFNDDRGLRIELVSELVDERRLVSCADVCLG
jgi:hypothetical protein